MMKKIIVFMLIVFINVQPSHAVENGEKEKGLSRTVALFVGVEYPGCSGFLYEPRIVLTAAHCTVNQYPVTHVGIPNNPTGLKAEKVSVENILYPDNYNKNMQYENDFAVLILSKPILVQGTVNLLTEEIKNKIENMNIQVKISGYGEQNSGGTTRETIRDAHYMYGTLAEISYEVKVLNNATGSVCSGDSGGPNTITYNNQEIYIGATSHGWNQPNCGRWGGGGQRVLIFDPVYKHINLIEKAKSIVGPSMPIIQETKTSKVVSSIIKKKCIKLKNGKCKK
jgi:secreted trypsin-like serine protease